MCPVVERVLKKYSVSNTLQMLELIKSQQAQQATTTFPSDCCRMHARETRQRRSRIS